MVDVEVKAANAARFLRTSTHILAVLHTPQLPPAPENLIISLGCYLTPVILNLRAHHPAGISGQICDSLWTLRMATPAVKTSETE